MTEHMEEQTKVLVEALEKPDEADPVGLVGRLMHANLRDYQYTTSCLIESYQKRISDLEAELSAVRTKVDELFAGDYMPGESAIIRAVFHPSGDLIDSCRKNPDLDSWSNLPDWGKKGGEDHE